MPHQPATIKAAAQNIVLAQLNAQPQDREPDLSQEIPMDSHDLLEAYVELESAKDVARLKLDERVADVQRQIREACPELWAKLQGTEEEREFVLKGYDARLEEIKTQLSDAVLLAESTVKTERATAIYYSGRTSLDIKGITKQLRVQPELAQMLKPFWRTGKPYMAIRRK